MTIPTHKKMCTLHLFVLCVSSRFKICMCTQKLENMKIGTDA